MGWTELYRQKLMTDGARCGGDPLRVRLTATQPLDLAIKVAGFGGQGVLLLGEVLAEAGLGRLDRCAGQPLLRAR